MDSNLVDIQKALIKDDLKSVISGMLELASGQKLAKLQNQIIHQSGRYHGNERSNSLGTTSSEQYNRTRNQLRYALQEILKQFPEYTDKISDEAQKSVLNEQDDGLELAVAPAEEEGVTKILMLTSNPSGTGKLQLEKEHSRISEKIQNSKHSDKYSIKSRKMVTISEFSESLQVVQPNIVHFSGHGDLNDKAIKQIINRGLGLTKKAADLDDAKSNSTGIILTSEDGQDPFFVPTPVIRRIFNSMTQRLKIPIQVVLFNSCYSEAQAEALADLVPHVIGTSHQVGDEAAIAFANGFYSFLTLTEGDIEAAWDNGVSLAMANGEPEERFVYFKNGEKISGSGYGGY